MARCPMNLARCPGPIPGLRCLKCDPVVLGDAPKSGTDIRREVIAQVEACVCRDRQNTYGDAEDNFADIAAIASVVLGPKLKEPLSAADVAAFSACIKLASFSQLPEGLIHHVMDFDDGQGLAVKVNGDYVL